MSGMMPSGSKINKMLMLGLAIILLCISAEMVRDTFYWVVIPMLPWIFGGVVLFFVGVFVWNRLRR